MSALRPDLQQIADRITPGERVLDIGCESGNLLAYLRDHRDVDGRGLELDQSKVNAAVARGLYVIQGDADHDLDAFPSDSFDTVILSRTLPAVAEVQPVLKALVRIGKRAIVTIPNAAHWRARLRLLFGHVPTRSDIEASAWYQTHAMHPASLADLRALLEQMDITLLEWSGFDHKGKPVAKLSANWRADIGLFVIQNKS